MTTDVAQPGDVTVTASATAYLAGALVDWVARDRSGGCREVDGTLVLADVSGFTAMTERLARAGRVGAEETSDLLSEVLSGLLEIAAREGGRLLKWCGDAVLLLYSGPSHAPRACRAAWDMRAAMGTLGRIRTSRGRLRLRLSVGVHSGPVELYLVGDSHRELIVAGPAAGAVVRAQNVAPTGQIAVSEQTATLLGPGRVDDAGLVIHRPPEPSHRPTPTVPGQGIPRPERDPFEREPFEREPFERDPFEREPIRTVPRQIASPDRDGGAGRTDHESHREDPSLVDTYLSTELRARIRGGDAGSEHRLVSVAFLEFAGVDALHARGGSSAVLSAVDAVVRRAQAACDRYHVTFLETDISEHGARIMMVTGAPRSYGHDAERLLRAVREVIEGGGTLSLRAGVHAGRVFSGELGPPWQRTFSIKGDAVNLAARVMQHAEPGQLLATAAALAPGHDIRAEPVPEFAVKGKSAPVKAFSVTRLGRPGRAGATAGPAESQPWHGREAELRTLRRWLARARAGRGRTVILDGPPGIGKSRLVAEFLRGTQPVPDSRDGGRPPRAIPAPRAHDSSPPVTASGDAATAPPTVLQVSCDTAVTGTAYALTDQLLRAALDVPSDASPQQAAEVLATAVRTLAPDLTPWIPLLATAVRADLPMTDETAALDMEFRKARLEQLLVTLLATLLPGPTVLVVDDAQLADPASTDVLMRLAQGIGRRPWLMLWCGTDLRTPDRGTVRRITLGELSPDDIAALLSEQVAAAHLLPHQRAAIAARAGGNPLFLRELTSLVGRGDGPTDLPESVEAVLAAGIDRLDPADRFLLRAAAVTGMQVDRSLLTEVLGESADEERWSRLSDFLAPAADGELRFRHGLIQEAAYQGLPYRLRRRLHLELGQALLRRAGVGSDAGAGSDASVGPDASAEVLSTHFFAAGEYASAAHFARIAGERAAAVYANPEAATLLARAWEAARRRRPAIPEEIARSAELCGDIYYRLGDFGAAGACFAAARPLMRRDPVALARLCLKSAQVVARTGSFPRALAWITRGRHLLAGSDDPQAIREDARLLVQMALVRQMEGRFDDAERACELAIAATRRVNATEVLGRALQLRDAADVARGRLDGVRWAEQALQIWQQLGDVGWQARALNQLGIRAYFHGRWDDALEHYRRAAEAFSRVGDEFNAAIAACNVAEILSDQGSYPSAEAMARRALEVLDASGALSETAFARSVLGRTAQRAGRFADAREQLNLARAAYLKAGERGEIAATDLRLAECMLGEGRAGEALSEADRIAAHGADPAVECTAVRLRGHALSLLGEAAAARVALRESLDLARRNRSRYDELLAVDALVRLDAAAAAPGDPDRDAEEDRATRSRLARQLGVLTVPGLPVGPPEPLVGAVAPEPLVDAGTPTSRGTVRR
jgi:class 3 adenylate cyclase/tetratricopeptide (TPR) repeat protein